MSFLRQTTKLLDRSLSLSGKKIGRSPLVSSSSIFERRHMFDRSSSDGRSFSSSLSGTCAMRGIQGNLSSSTTTTTAPNNTAGHRRYMSSLNLKDAYENILVEKHEEDKVALITLNRPKVLNALNGALFQDLLHATKALDDDDSVRCIVLTGSSKAFAAGADISEMKDKTFEECYATDMFSEWQDVSKLQRTPIIAAVAGYALGGGAELAMMCDTIVCSQSAKFGQPEINLAVIPGAGGTQRLTRAIGKSKAMLMNLTGDMIDSQEAYASGLVAKVFDDEELVDEAMKISKKIASKAKLAVQAAKEAVNAAEELPLEEGLRFERRLFHSLFATEDQKEGMSAFLEKRKPNLK
eukprot:CAMPEP_0113490898 /NCGR_PEP_ID=MMETSP0014_2-20120614/27281_1 /TAXON_ID=2857 /ORGANISM="Nitzschia sp." /LENGTH=351 /DNA_ID=CAMNT_0000384679 /DNA_START=159 /DNA_END=1214 /DNA_ORIENTATION=+ /assembly_acc=CAM_ASM_000159